MKRLHRAIALTLSGVLLTAAMAGCGSTGSAQDSTDRTIVRIGHNQATDHPTHISLLAFEEYIEDKLGDKYDVEVYPSELLGSQTDMVQLTQTGAIDFCVASNSILETFSENYTMFNMPYLFASSDAYHAAMDDPEITDPIFESTKKQALKRLHGLMQEHETFIPYPSRLRHRLT